MTDVVLQFSTRSDLSSAAIEWFSAGNLSHVDAVLPDGRLLGSRFDRLGDMPRGVWIRPHDYTGFKRALRFHIPASQEQHDAFYKFLSAQVGKPYDWRAIVGFAIERSWRDADSWICSELIAAGLEAAAIVPKLYLDANKIAPVPLALVCSAIPGRIISPLA